MDSTTLGWFPQFLEFSKEYILTDPSLMWGLPLFHTPFLSLPTVENGPMSPYGVPWRNINCGIYFSFFFFFSSLFLISYFLFSFLIFEGIILLLVRVCLQTHIKSIIFHSVFRSVTTHLML